MSCAACSGSWSSLAHIPPGWIQPASRATLQHGFQWRAQSRTAKNKAGECCQYTGGINQWHCLCRFTAHRWRYHLQCAAIFNFQPATSTRSHNLHGTPWRANPLRLSAARSEWTARRPIPGWWSSQRIQASATGVGNIQILAGSTDPGATGRA